MHIHHDVEFFFQTADYLRTHTYDHVPGNKYPLLVQYYTLLEQCIEQGATVKVGHIKYVTKSYCDVFETTVRIIVL